MKSIIRKQVTFTHIHAGKIVKSKDGAMKLNENGGLDIEMLPVVTLMGNISEPKCKRHMRSIDTDAQVYDIHYETVTYALSLDDFMKHGYIEDGDSK